MGVAAIRDALKVRLETIPGLRAHDTVPSSVTPPAATVIPAADTFAIYSVAFGGIHNLAFVVTLVVSKTWDRTAQDSLDSYIDSSGANSVYAAFEGDPTLGGLVASATLLNASNYGLITWGDIQYLGCEFPVEVQV